MIQVVLHLPRRELTNALQAAGVPATDIQLFLRWRVLGASQTYFNDRPDSCMSVAAGGVLGRYSAAYTQVQNPVEFLRAVLPELDVMAARLSQPGVVVHSTVRELVATLLEMRIEFIQAAAMVLQDVPMLSTFDLEPFCNPAFRNWAHGTMLPHIAKAAAVEHRPVDLASVLVRIEHWCLCACFLKKWC